MADLITITDAAAKVIEEKISQKEGAIGLRLRIKTGGCAGKEYKMEHVMGDDDVSKDDEFRNGDAILYIPLKDTMNFVGTVIDYNEDQMSSGFVFNNPNVANSCGCGESFDIQDLPQPPSKPNQP
ncbi:MAG: iron-sulfur cluster assembly accessory protein [Alphaproteobacteria bacterium]|nr:iron-sulfur cluster assembly accessory protein [Alphaproteobacteria bacterium]